MREFTRRRWMGLAAAGPLLARSGWAQSAAALAAPLERPARPVRQLDRVAMLGLARAGSRIVAVGERGTVLLSEDEGTSWRQAAAVPVSVSLTAAQFVDARLGWAVGHQGVVLHSSDGGDHWERQLEGAKLAELQLVEAQAGAREAAIADAQRAKTEGADKPLFALHFTDARNGMAVGAFGAAIATTDGGKSWSSVRTRIENPKGAHLYALSQVGGSILVAGEQGLVAHSPDGGRHFERLSTSYQGSWFCAVQDSSGTWLVAGLRGNAMRSADAGRTWTALSGAAPVGYTAALADQSGRVLLVNQGGEIVAAEPGRAELALVARTAAQQPGQMLRLLDGSILMAGWNGLTRAARPDVGKR